MCNTCNTTNTIATNVSCNPYNVYNPCLSRLLNCLFGGNTWGNGGCANTVSNSCYNHCCGQWSSQRVCRDCYGNLRVYTPFNSCGCWNGYSNGCLYNRTNSGCHSCNVCAQTFSSAQTSINGDDYYANQYGLNGRSNRCGCSLGVNYGV